MKERICNLIDKLNKVYDAHISVDKGFNGWTQIITDDGREFLFEGSESEVEAWLKGWEDAAQLFESRATNRSLAYLDKALKQTVKQINQ